MWNFSPARVQQFGQVLSLILLVRKRHLSWLLLVNQVHCSQDHKSAEVNSWQSSAKMVDDSVRINISNGLLLYYNQYSFYSQKVVMALHEKKLPFESHIIDLTCNEQYQHWFLQINPKGEVPVLQDSGKIIPDSSRIIDYLEDNFTNGDTPRLIPLNIDPQIRQNITHFRNLIEPINGNVLTIGSFLHEDLVTGSRKVPFIGPVRTQLLRAENNSAVNLRKIAVQFPEMKDELLKKAANQEKRHKRLLNKDEFIKILQETDDVFTKIEAELCQHTGDKKDWWLCTSTFTVADINLTILLERLSQVGLENYFWANGKRPHLEEYYRRVQERDSYKKTIPTTFMFLKMVFVSQAPIILGVGIAAVVALIVGGWFVVKKITNK